MTDTTTQRFAGPKIADIKAFFTNGAYTGGPRRAHYSAEAIARALNADARQTPKRLKELEDQGFLTVNDDSNGTVFERNSKGRMVLAFRLSPAIRKTLEAQLA